MKNAIFLRTETNGISLTVDALITNYTNNTASIYMGFNKMLYSTLSDIMQVENIKLKDYTPKALILKRILHDLKTNDMVLEFS